MRAAAPLVILLIGLLIATILEAVIALPLRRLLATWPEALRWVFTLAFAALAAWTGGRHYFTVFRRPVLSMVVLVTLPILLAFRLLADRVAELPSPFGLVVAAVLGLLAGGAVWQLGRASNFRPWLAALFGALVFVNLFYGAPGAPR
ncbi:hypothetical protein [Deinococcus peraridilitoris]|uniref:Uncharacterized protein n=1 Tax=Deinococcus peraridilitoris (strain DSM 19664 / LMG 22246 / CIP 109416 / KR-200) TaxID=937777 RepID=K9ZYS7_DEIPD|nr:hypothetical protein [Deinococcus peraridilitoris]AFZ66736.1 hypothetical protein Deipe_1180 [Deinococcus peraridilitoris DSM 19664]